jgi:dTDP-4-amino-4,6-dideoxygalactose transaminase
VLQVKLRDLDRGNAARRENALIYRGLLADVAGVRLEPPADHGTSVYHLLVVRVAGRDRVLEGMGRREIACGVHYPTPIHLQPAYAHLGLGPGSFPIAERSAREVLSLPMFPELTAGQIALVAKELAAVVAAPRLVEALGV